jgi:uncharacterized membrane protein
MTTQAVHHSSDQSSGDSLATEQVPRIKQVPVTAPLAWLKSGWTTLIHAPGPSLLYGLLFSIACLAVAALTIRNPGFTTAFLTGLLLIGPVLATGLYVAARQHERGEPVSIGASLKLLWDRRTNLSLFVVFLALVMAAWLRLAALLFAVKVTAFAPTAYNWEGFLNGSFDPVVLGFLVVIGAILALAVFVSSAVAIPLIADRDAGPIAAVSTSYQAVRQNLPAMALWAALIAGLTVFGILTWFIGMLFLFPLLGYATWQSYRDLVE